MKYEIDLHLEREMREFPKSCSVCAFVDVCDGIIADMTKIDGVQFKVAYMRKRAKGCPLVERDNN